VDTHNGAEATFGLTEKSRKAGTFL
jgi:hypothetical protein